MIYENWLNEIKNDLTNLVSELQKQNKALAKELEEAKNGKIMGYNIMTLVAVAGMLDKFEWDETKTKILLKNTHQAYKLGMEDMNNQYKASFEIIKESISNPIELKKDVDIKKGVKK